LPKEKRRGANAILRVQTKSAICLRRAELFSKTQKTACDGNVKGSAKFIPRFCCAPIFCFLIFFASEALKIFFMLDNTAKDFFLPGFATASERLKISVAIPVKNEAQNLAATLRALTRQVDLSGRLLDSRIFEIIVLINNSSDESAAVARSFSRPDLFPLVHVFEIDFPSAAAHIGTARRVAMDAAFRRFHERGQKGIIAATDGDTRVAADWLAATINEFERGAEAVCGRILLDKNELAALPPAVRRTHLQDAAYRLLAAELEGWLDATQHDSNPRHHQHFGASFAVASDVYARVGGLPIRPFLEDLAFYERLVENDVRVRHSPFVRVRTSARREGRAAVGLSWQLNEWSHIAAANKDCFVESADELAFRFRLSRDLRQFWLAGCRRVAGTNKSKILSQTLGINKRIFDDLIYSAKTFGKLRSAVFQIAKLPIFPKIPLAQAINDLRCILRKTRSANFSPPPKRRSKFVMRDTNQTYI
jgi:glycosyltransferase involved in cell wall biosynthesis